MMIRILWLDEDPDYLCNGKRELEKCRDVCIETAVSVQEALKKLNASAFDLVISEYFLSGTDGIRFMQKIRSHYFPFAKVPLLLFTARDDSEVLTWSLETPFNFHQNKKGDTAAQYQALLKMLVVIRMKMDLIEKPVVPASLSFDQIMNLPFPAFAVRSDGSVGFWNFALARLTGKESGTMTGTAHHEYAVPFLGKPAPFLIDVMESDTPEIARKYPGLLREGKNCIFDMVIPDQRTGSDILARFIAVPYFNGGEKPDGILVTVQNFSEYWSALQEKALEPAALPRSLDDISQTENLLRTIFEKNGAASLVISSDTTVILAKNEFARLAGYFWPDTSGIKRWTLGTETIPGSVGFGTHTVLPDKRAGRTGMLDSLNPGPGSLKNSA